MTANDTLTHAPAITAARSDYARGFDDGFNKRRARGTSENYADGYEDGREARIENDYETECERQYRLERQRD